jgi:hypothetical protein
MTTRMGVCPLCRALFQGQSQNRLQMGRGCHPTQIAGQKTAAGCRLACSGKACCDGGQCRGDKQTVYLRDHGLTPENAPPRQCQTRDNGGDRLNTAT